MVGKRYLSRAAAFLGMFAFAFFSASALNAAEKLKLFHPEVVTELTTRGSDGHQLGDVRVISKPVLNASGKVIGRLDATLITTGVDAPNKGDEVRISELVFTLNDGSMIIIGGAGHYPAQGPTLIRGSKLVRPIKGGSGRYAGARGWAESKYQQTGGWVHEFYIRR
jgi:hypothetical protein